MGVCELSCTLFLLSFPFGPSFSCLIKPQTPTRPHSAYCSQLSGKGEETLLPELVTESGFTALLLRLLCTYESPIGLDKKQIVIQKIEGGA